MKRSSPRHSRSSSARLAQASVDALAHARYPELHFRAMPPSEALIAVAREQDALCRAVVGAGLGIGRIQIERQAGAVGTLHAVSVALVADGANHCGQAEHPSAEIALREAYTVLLRHVLRATPCTYVVAA